MAEAAAEMKSHRGNSALHPANQTALLVGRGLLSPTASKADGTSHLNINNALVAKKEKKNQEVTRQGGRVESN